MKKILSIPFLWYLRILVRLQLWKINPIIIGIGGASGKSSLAQILYQILSDKFKVKQSGGKNSETGIPLSVLDIKLESYSFLDWFKAALTAPLRLITNWNKYDYFVVEMGIDSPYPPKNMEYLLKIIQPKIGALTNIFLEHSLYFDPISKSDSQEERKKEILEETAKQEGLLLKSIRQDGLAVLNLDDPNITGLLPLKSKTVTISEKNKSADFYIVSSKVEEKSFTIKFIFLSDLYVTKIPQALPKYYTLTIVMALAIAFSCAVSIKDAIDALSKNFSLPAGRFGVFGGIKNSIILDSSYNSSLEPAIGALNALEEIAGAKRKVGILGDMRELGSLSQIQHELLAKEILKSLDFAILIGPLMAEFVAPILKKENFEFVSFDSFKNAKESIPGSVKKDDLILVKGSQNTLFLERAVEMLLEDKSDAKKLCRRGDFWDSVRKAS